MEEVEQLTKFAEALAKVKSKEAQKGLTQILQKVLCKPFVVQSSESIKIAKMGR